MAETAAQKKAKEKAAAAAKEAKEAEEKREQEARDEEERNAPIPDGVEPGKTPGYPINEDTGEPLKLTNAEREELAAKTEAGEEVPGMISEEEESTPSSDQEDSTSDTEEPEMLPDPRETKGGVLGKLREIFDEVAEDYPDVTYEEVAQVLRDSGIKPAS